MKKDTLPTTLDEYIAGFPKDTQVLLQQVRATVSSKVFISVRPKKRTFPCSSGIARRPISSLCASLQAICRRPLPISRKPGRRYFPARRSITSFSMSSSVAWWAMQAWLANYAVRIGLNVWMFALPVLAILVIALVTVSFQTVKTALANPTDSLKSE